MARLDVRILSYCDEQVTLRQRNILEKLKENPKTSKKELLNVLKDKNDPISDYELESELGKLQGKGLLDDKYRVINIKESSDLFVLPEEIKEKPIRSKIKRGFYDGTNSIKQSRKWLRETINKEKAKLFVLNPDRTLELVKLGVDKSFLKENRISLKQFPETNEIFSNALDVINRLAENKSRNRDWHGFVTFLMEFIFDTVCFGVNDIVIDTDDDSDEVYWSPETFDNRKFIDLVEFGSSDIITKDTLLSKQIPFFGDVYDVIINTLDEAVSKNDEDGFKEADLLVNDIIDEVSGLYVRLVYEVQKEKRESNLKPKDYKWIEQLYASPALPYETLFVAIWCLFWRMYFKEL